MEKNYRRWKSVAEEKQILDKETDQKIWSNIDQYIQKRKKVTRFYWAAAVAIPLMTGVLLMNVNDFGKKDSEITISAHQEKKVYQLKDGSVITLEIGSSLVISENFGDKDRNVAFRGKGFFNIAKNKALPFKINAEEFDVEVLGTQFYLDQTSAEKKVHLTEGKVKIDYKNQQVFLSPKQIWKLDEKGENSVFLEPSVKKQFTFENQKYSEVIDTLEEVYLIKIRYPEEFNNEIVNGSFTGNLEEILTIISFPFDLNIKNIDDQNIEMKK